MRWHWRMVVGLSVITLGVALLSRVGPGPSERRLKATRLALRKEKFKIDLAEFDLSLPTEMRQRMAVLGTTTREAITNGSHRHGSVPYDGPS